MYNLEFFKTLDEQTSNLVKQFIDLNPIGSMTLNDNLEIVSINKSLEGYFDDDIESTMKFFGNVFGCHYVSDNASICGTKRQCLNCKIRNNMLNALEFNRAIKNIQVNKSFVVNGLKKIMWFDMTIVPIEINDKKYLWVSLIDLTELMKYKIEFEMNNILDDEKNALDKDRFHEDVMACIRTNCYSGGEAYLTLIELKHSEDVQENFGSLWRNDYISSFHHYLSDRVDTSDFICRYSLNQFLIFLPCKGHVDFNRLIVHLKDYHYKYFNAFDDVICKSLKFKINSDKIKEIVNSDQLYLEYFKAISLLEQLDEEDVVEMIL